MNSKGKRVDLQLDTLKDRPEDMAYFACMCSVNPTLMYKRMEQEVFDINFSLKILPSVYDLNQDTVVQESVRKRKPSGSARSVAKGLSRFRVKAPSTG